MKNLHHIYDLKYIRMWHCFLALIVLLSVCLFGQDPRKARGLVPVGKPIQLVGKTYALLIGISQYQKVHSLEFADKDAELLAEFLKSPMGGVNPADIFLLTNERATRAAIDDAVKNFVGAHAGPDNSLIFFVAGHGIYLKSEEDPQTGRVIERDPYILTYDSNPQDANTTGYPMQEFRGMVAEQALRFGRVLVYVDVCHADNVAGIAGGSELQPAVRKVFQGQAGALDLMVASYANKYAFESPAFGGGHGAFSYFLVSGLNGSAAVQGADNLHWSELAHYVNSQVYDYTARKQSPRDYPSQEDLVVVPDLHQQGIVLVPPKPLSQNAQREARNRQGYIQPVIEAPSTANRGDVDDLSTAIARGALLPEDPASAFQIAMQPPAGSPNRMEAERRLRVAMEDAGQQVISHYLEGDQIPQIRDDFVRCGRLFGEAALLQPASNVEPRKFDTSRSLFCRGRSLIFDRRYPDAEQLLRQSIQLDPRRGYAWNALGISRLEQISRTITAPTASAFFDDAANDFRTAIRYAPYWAYPVHNLALTLSEQGDFDSAIKTYRFAMDLAPQFSYLPYNLGLLYVRVGDLSEAEHWFRSAERIAVTYPRKQDGRWAEKAEPLNALGTLALQRHDTPRARRYFEDALADDPRNPVSRQNLALLSAAQGDYKRADQLWLELMKDSPDYIAGPVARAESLLARGDIAAAIQQYNDVLSRQPDWAGAHEALARLYFSSGDFENGLTAVNSALSAAPSNPFLLELRGDINSRLGRTSGALSDWNKALDLASDKGTASRIRRKLKRRAF
jgi:Flp pilus assembly protein TadD